MCVWIGREKGEGGSESGGELTVRLYGTDGLLLHVGNKKDNLTIIYTPGSNLKVRPSHLNHSLQWRQQQACL